MRHIASVLIASTASVALLAGCPSREVSKVEVEQQKQEPKVIPVETVRDVDILFVIDDSESMGEEQASLIKNFPGFIAKLQSIQGGLPNIHIAIASTDMGAQSGITGCDSGDGDNGELQADFVGTDPACSDMTVSLDGNEPFISDIEDEDNPGTRIRNYSGMLNDDENLAKVFSCMAQLGLEGCGFEQPLESMRRALEKDSGFLRPNAFLAIIFISDEDDCSTYDKAMFETRETPALGQPDSFRCFEFGVQCNPDDARSEGDKYECVPRVDSPFMYNVDEYVDFVKGLKGDPSQVIVAGIIGIDPEDGPVNVFTEDRRGPNDTEPKIFHVLKPACVTESMDTGDIIGNAAPAVRLKYFLEQFPGRNSITTICDEDLTDALDLVGSLLAKVLDNPFCLTVDVDLDEADGLQYDCQVSDVLPPVTTGGPPDETPLEHCNGDQSNLPCWHIEVNEEGCTNVGPPFQELVVERGDQTVSPATQVVVKCAVN
ncbi:hypothetical protein [Haliangium sp.]|uniref:hypothetical protein n=1 Tax=Haliangium sp. TaxID=2663208 RepID=UPI003D0A5DE2